MKIKTIENGIRLENDGKSLEVTIVNEKWVTVHPNGKENKGRHLLIRDGETIGQAIERKFGGKQAEMFGKDTDLGKTDYKKSEPKDAWDRLDELKQSEKEKEDDKKRTQAYKDWQEEKKREDEKKRAEHEKEIEYDQNKEYKPLDIVKFGDGRFGLLAEGAGDGVMEDANGRRWSLFGSEDSAKKAKEEKESKKDAGDSYSDLSRYSDEELDDMLKKEKDRESAYYDRKKKEVDDNEELKKLKDAHTKAKEGYEPDKSGQDNLNKTAYDYLEKQKSLTEDWENKNKAEIDDISKKVGLIYKEQSKRSGQKQEDKPKAEEKKTIDNIEDFVVSRSNGGYYASAKETRIYKNGNSTARVEELEGGHYAVDLKRNGVSLAHKYYTTKSGAEKALKEHLAGFEAKKLEKTNLDEKRQAYESVLKAYRENHYKTWHSDSDEERRDAWDKAEVAKKALTKARREYAESIMANFEEASENPYEERQQARKERYEELSGKAQERSDAIGKSASDKLGAIPFGQPIHGQADRNYREKAWAQIDRSVKEGEKAEHYAEKAKSVGTAGISSDDANAIAKLAVKYNSGTIDSAEKRRIIDRVIDIDKRNRMLKQQAESGKKEDYSDLGFDVERNGNINRLQLKFSGIPSGDIRAKLKSHGFRWSPREGAWQRQLSTNAEWSFKRLVEELRKKGE